jgi:hypothetical protein
VIVEKISLKAKFAAFSEHWRPKVVTEFNGHEVFTAPVGVRL